MEIKIIILMIIIVIVIVIVFIAGTAYSNMKQLSKRSRDKKNEIALRHTNARYSNRTNY